MIGWIAEALVLAFIAARLARVALRALDSWRWHRQWTRDNAARKSKREGAAHALAETCWLLSRKPTIKRRAQLEAMRERQMRRLVRAFGMGDDGDDE